MKKVNPILTTLLLITLILGAATYYRLHNSVVPSPTKTERQPVVPDNPNLSSKQKQVFLSEPASSTSSDTILKFMYKLSFEAVAAKEVVIDNCDPAPVIARVKEGGSIVFKNASSSPIKLSLLKKKYDLSSGSTVKVGPLSAGLLNARKSIPYGCDNEHIVGYLYISP